MRPQSFSQLVGQEDNIARLKVIVDAARIRDTAVDHILLEGPPGLGKTTIAGVVAAESNNEMIVANGGNLSSIKDICDYLSKLQGGILFIDEIHRITNKVAEFLYPVMEDYRIDINDDSVSKDLQPFTMIGATTEAGMLPKPLQDRFVHKIALTWYSIKALTKISMAYSDTLDAPFLPECANYIAKVGRGTPRIVRNYTKWVADVALTKKVMVPTLDFVVKCMTMIGVDKYGLTLEDHAYIKTLRRLNVASVATLAASSGLSRETIEYNIEPYLLRRGLLKKSSRGRELCT